MVSGDLDDADLIELAAHGDREAFAALFRRHHRLVHRFARQMSGCAATADDVTQDVFVAVMRNLSRFDPAMGSFTTYLYGIARRTVRRRMFWRARQVQLDEVSVDPAAAPEGDPVAVLARERALGSLRRAIVSLPVHYREALVLCDLDGLSYAAAAAVIGCRIGTVRSRLSRARTLLARKLADQPSVLDIVPEPGRSTRCLA
jgi:RNA polymerase sigma-70 factor (ECF subfamily)